MLKRLKAFLRASNYDPPLPETMISDLILLLFMLTENDGKNVQQLHGVFGRFGVADLCTALLISSSSSRFSAWGSGAETIVRSLLTMIMWINPEEIFEREPAEKTETILDILEPLAIQSDAHGHISINCVYFDLRGLLVLSSLAYTRLCVVERYDVIKRRQTRSCVMPSSRVALISGDIDADFFRLARFDRVVTSPDSESSSSTMRLTSAAFETLWTGGWFVPNPEGSSVFTVYRPMRFCIREYISLSSDDAIQFVDNVEEEQCLTKAWFNEGVQFSERFSLLSIFDPITGRTSLYEPKPSDYDATAVVDTVLFGETIAEDGGETFRDFTFHGRIRKADGKIALIRKPTNADTHDLGVWVFHGFLNYGYNGYNFVGDWWNTSTAKDAPGGSGWFRFISEDNHRSNNEAQV